MAGWDGSGNFTLNYSFVVQRDAGVKILASQMDTQFATVATGLMNVLCRDGQNKPSANIDWNSKKITNLANGSSSGDAVNYGQMAAFLSEWVAEANGLTWVSATQFKVTNADVTGVYHAGRRIKSTNTAGTVYSTVVSSSYSAPDTTINVINDGAGALDSGFTTLRYGLVSYVNPSYLTPRSIVMVRQGSDQNNVGNFAVKVNLNTESYDLLSEFDAVTNYRFVAKYPGTYIFLSWIVLTSTSDTVGAAYYYFNGSPSVEQVCGLKANTLTQITAIQVATLSAGDYVELYGQASAGTVNITDAFFTAHRLT